MPQRFTATENAFEKGIETTSPAQGRKLVDDWQTELRKADFAGAKGIAGDLDRLSKALDDDQPDRGRIASILKELGEATTKAADRADDERVAEKVRALGDALRARVNA